MLESVDNEQFQMEQNDNDTQKQKEEFLKQQFCLKKKTIDRTFTSVQEDQLGNLAEHSTKLSSQVSIDTGKVLDVNELQSLSEQLVEAGYVTDPTVCQDIELEADAESLESSSESGIDSDLNANELQYFRFNRSGLSVMVSLCNSTLDDFSNKVQNGQASLPLLIHFEELCRQKYKLPENVGCLVNRYCTVLPEALLHFAVVNYGEDIVRPEQQDEQYCSIGEKETVTETSSESVNKSKKSIIPQQFFPTASTSTTLIPQYRQQDRLTSVINDILYRLNRQGILADPRDVCRKRGGRSGEYYETDDMFFDDSSVYENLGISSNEYVCEISKDHRHKRRLISRTQKQTAINSAEGEPIEEKRTAHDEGLQNNQTQGLETIDEEDGKSTIQSDASDEDEEYDDQLEEEDNTNSGDVDWVYHYQDLSGFAADNDLSKDDEFLLPGTEASDTLESGSPTAVEHSEPEENGSKRSITRTSKSKTDLEYFTMKHWIRRHAWRPFKTKLDKSFIIEVFEKLEEDLKNKGDKRGLYVSPKCVYESFYFSLKTLFEEVYPTVSWDITTTIHSYAAEFEDYGNDYGNATRESETAHKSYLENYSFSPLKQKDDFTHKNSKNLEKDSQANICRKTSESSECLSVAAAAEQVLDTSKIADSEVSDDNTLKNTTVSTPTKFFQNVEKIKSENAEEGKLSGSSVLVVPTKKSKKQQSVPLARSLVKDLICYTWPSMNIVSTCMTKISSLIKSSFMKRVWTARIILHNQLIYSRLESLLCDSIVKKSSLFKTKASLFLRNLKKAVDLYLKNLSKTRTNCSSQLQTMSLLTIDTFVDEKKNNLDHSSDKPVATKVESPFASVATELLNWCIVYNCRRNDLRELGESVEEWSAPFSTYVSSILNSCIERRRRLKPAAEGLVVQRKSRIWIPAKFMEESIERFRTEYNVENLYEKRQHKPATPIFVYPCKTLTGTGSSVSKAKRVTQKKSNVVTSSLVNQPSLTQSIVQRRETPQLTFRASSTEVEELESQKILESLQVNSCISSFSEKTNELTSSVLDGQTSHVNDEPKLPALCFIEEPAAYEENVAKNSDDKLVVPATNKEEVLDKNADCIILKSSQRKRRLPQQMEEQCKLTDITFVEHVKDSTEVLDLKKRKCDVVSKEQQLFNQSTLFSYFSPQQQNLCRGTYSSMQYGSVLPQPSFKTVNDICLVEKTPAVKNIKNTCPTSVPSIIPYTMLSKSLPRACCPPMSPQFCINVTNGISQSQSQQCFSHSSNPTPAYSRPLNPSLQRPSSLLSPPLCVASLHPPTLNHPKLHPSILHPLTLRPPTLQSLKNSSSPSSPTSSTCTRNFHVKSPPEEALSVQNTTFSSDPGVSSPLSYERELNAVSGSGKKNTSTYHSVTTMGTPLQIDNRSLPFPLKLSSMLNTYLFSS